MAKQRFQVTDTQAERENLCEENFFQLHKSKMQTFSIFPSSGTDGEKNVKSFFVSHFSSVQKLELEIFLVPSFT